MELKSCIYESSIMHLRLSPKKNRFQYKLYTFYLDLDELDEIPKQVKFFSHNHFNLFSFYESDHINLGEKNLKENIKKYAKDSGCKEKIEKIYLLTNIRILGYVFNPVCFYYCFDENEVPVCCVVEIHNTFGEAKPYYISNSELKNSVFKKRVSKMFYVSPFLELDTEFDFILRIPDQKLIIKIDDFKLGEKILLSSYWGERNSFTTWKILYFFFKYPLITIKVISLIHIQAFILMLKKIPFYRKIENLSMQIGVFHGKNSKQGI